MNKVVHFEVPFDDKERAMKFYKEVFGWEMQDMPEMNYVITRTVSTDEKMMPKEPGAINGGMYKRDEQSSKTPVIVIDVQSIDDSVKRTEESGGSIFRPKVEIPGMGFYAQVKDSEGNIIGLFENIKK